MLKYLETFCSKIRFPQVAIQDLSENYIKLCKNEKELENFQELVVYFKENNKKEDYKLIFSKLDLISERSGVNKYSIHMLYLIALSVHTKFLYEREGISSEIYWSSMTDLRAKLVECDELYGIWGTSAGWWEIDFFNLNLIALGRIQYEIIEFDEEYKSGNIIVNQGDKVINMHIPSIGPLLYEDCKASFDMAAEFYKDYFIDRPVIFVCHSWLLYPEHVKFLPKESNIIKFMSFFDIISSEVSTEKLDLWRVFYKDWEKEPIELPRNTTLQRAYADWLLEGNNIGVGQGIFIYN